MLLLLNTLLVYPESVDTVAGLDIIVDVITYCCEMLLFVESYCWSEAIVCRKLLLFLPILI